MWVSSQASCRRARGAPTGVARLERVREAPDLKQASLAKCLLGQPLSRVLGDIVMAPDGDGDTVDHFALKRREDSCPRLHKPMVDQAGCEPEVQSPARDNTPACVRLAGCRLGAGMVCNQVLSYGNTW
jgi:hypothetical protein